jgi:hypothetical protein
MKRNQFPMRSRSVVVGDPNAISNASLRLFLLRVACFSYPVGRLPLSRQPFLMLAANEASLA